MDIKKPMVKDLLTDKQALRELAWQVNKEAGVIGDPSGSLADLRDSITASGVDPSERLGSSELMRMRYGEEWNEEDEE
jgi:hypothetical protein